MHLIQVAFPLAKLTGAENYTHALSTHYDAAGQGSCSKRKCILLAADAGSDMRIVIKRVGFGVFGYIELRSR